MLEQMPLERAAQQHQSEARFGLRAATYGLRAVKLLVF
jgi:hypothetical protein